MSGKGIAELVLADTADHEGMDEWEIRLFDMDNDADPFTPEHSYVGSFALCVQDAADFISKNTTVAYRVVIERVM